MSLPSEPGAGLDESAREEFDDERPSGPSSRAAPRRSRPRQPLQVAALAVLVVLLIGGALAWRAHHRRKVVAEGLARAEALLRKDTSAGYHEAARLLEPLVELDPVGAGAARGFALAMLALDYRDGDAARRAEELLVVPGRASDVPRFADLGYGALALARREAGTAMSYAARGGGSPWSAVLHARVAMLAGKLDAARDPIDRAASADPRFPAVQALRGDVLRRTGHATQAREAYVAALAASPLHARATYGLAKLALAGSAPADEAREPLRRLLDDAGTPSAERARAALHLASIDARAGRVADSAAALDRASVGIPARAWLDRAVAEAAHGTGYRVPAGTPAVLESASDDDPFVAPPKPPPPTAISPTFRLPEPAPRAAPRSTAKPAPKAAPPKQSAKPSRAAAKPTKGKADAKAKSAARTEKRPTAAKPSGAKAKTPAKSAAPATQESALSSALAKVSASAPPPKAEKPGARSPAKATTSAPASKDVDAASRR